MRDNNKKEGRSTKVVRGNNSMLTANQRTQVNSLTLTGNEDLATLVFDNHGDVELFIFRDKTKENVIVVLGSKSEKELIEFVSNTEIDKENSTIRIKHDTTKENVLFNKNERLLSLLSVSSEYKLDNTEIEVLSDDWKENTLVNDNSKLLKLSLSEPDKQGRAKTHIEVLRDKELIDEVERINKVLLEFIDETKDNFVIVNERIDDTEKALDSFKEEINKKVDDFYKEFTEFKDTTVNTLKELFASVSDINDSLDEKSKELENVNKELTTVKESNEQTKQEVDLLKEEIEKLKLEIETKNKIENIIEGE